MRAIAVGRTARRRHRLDPLVGRDGSLDARDATAARRIAARLNEARPAEPERHIAGGDVTAIAVLGAVLHEVVRRERSAPGREVERAAQASTEALGAADLASVSRAWRREFGEAEPSTTDLVGEVLVLSALNDNPAATGVRELVDDRPLRAASPYAKLVRTIDAELRAAAQASAAVDSAIGTGRSRAQVAGGARARRRLALPALLRAPARRAPGSLADQLRWIRANWPEVLADDPALAERVALAIDLLAEEARAFELQAARAGFGGPVAAEAPDYRGLDAEPEAFSPDTEWMPSVVLIAKSSHVWLNQLSRTYARPVANLADVPDAELDRLASLGVTGLWLIGLWQRSRASAEIKRRRGDADAVASAYSIDEYRIADDLGGEAAYEALKARAGARGIRLAADMVPNHMGLDSRWVVEHPDRFISVPEAPFPAYSFGGPNLSPDPRVELTIEDHYWDGTDAAVVFRRRDTASGETRFIYHGNDGTSFPWNDTAQLDYLQPAVREAVIETILSVARRAPILRFDAAMVLARRHIRRLWYPRPGEGGAIPSRAEHAISDAEFDALMPTEFWRDVVDRVARDAPGTLLLAEAFWLMEGYFVRTLGMHRVYNSAFMHMLRDEDNAGYRRVMKDTLEFDPGVLGRFVNFMTNPDERPAAEQFGTGDKAFAVAILLATMPGLPMLGHGQVEGYRERYGMEFRAARWDEPVDAAHAEHFERVISPLLRRRADFAGTERFHLYDAVGADGSVVEDVFAYSNKRQGRRTLVLVHNRFGEADVRIDRSVAAATRDAAGHKRRTSTRLARALGLPSEDGAQIQFRDGRSGRERRVAAGELRDRGLGLHLGPYEAIVFDVEVVPAEAAVQPPKRSASPTDDVFEALAGCFELTASLVAEGSVGVLPGLRFGAVGGPIADLNRLMPTSMPAEDADRLLDAALAELEGYPALSAWVPPNVQPVDLADRFLARGFTRSDEAWQVPAMTRPLDEIPEPAVPGAIIRVATSAADVLAGNQVIATAFGAPPELGELLARMFEPAVLDPDSPATMVVVTLDDQVVATALGVHAGDVAGIYNVGTLPSHQGRGFGAAATLAAIAAAARAGAKTAVLESSEAGYNVYRRIGFVEAGRFDRLERIQPEPQSPKSTRRRRGTGSEP